MIMTTIMIMIMIMNRLRRISVRLSGLASGNT
jgi:hypothetical protein